MNNQPAKPVIILPTGKVSKADIRMLRKNGLCVIEAEDPSLIRFLEPPPGDYGPQEKAAIATCRHLMGQCEYLNGREIKALFANFIIKGTTLEYSKPPQSVKA